MFSETISFSIIVHISRVNNVDTDRERDGNAGLLLSKSILIRLRPF